jgi:phosphoglycolate phosphatase
VATRWVRGGKAFARPFASDGRAVWPDAPRTAYIGDTHFDTGAAQAAQIPCVICRFGFNQGQTDHLGADAVIDHFDALVPALLDLGGR